MAAINSGSNNSNSNSTSAGGSNMYRVGDYVYFEAQQQQQQQQQSMHHQQQQPFQIRRIEELNKTAGGNVEAKVMCFYRRRDLPAQLVALADKHQQHQQQQQLSLTLSLSPGGSSTVKGAGKQSSAIKSSSASDKDASTDKKEQDTSGALQMVKKEQQNDEQSASKTETSEINESVKEELQQQQDVEMSEDVETNSSVSAAVKSGDGDETETNEKSSDVVKDEDKTTQGTQPQHDWWRGEQLKQRELFLSRQVETLAATHIRGKCTVTLYNETESLDSYLEREDTFFYCLVFDPVQKTLLADKGEIRVGHKYQAEVPPKALFNRGSSDLNVKDVTTTSAKGDIVKEENITDGDGEEPMATECSQDDEDDDDKDVDAKSSTAMTTVTTIGTVTAMTMESDSELETLIWTCRPQWNRLTDRQIDQFLVVSRSLGTFARALDCTSSVKQPSLHMSAAAASRDITLFHAMDTLHRHGYDLGTATCSLVPSTGPVLCRDEMEEWSASEANLFEEALEKYGKDFGDIRHDFLPWKTHKNIVEYYYMWKTTDRYVQQKRVKAVEQESKLKQVYIPSYNGTSGGKQQAITSGVTIKSSQQQQQLVNGNSGAMELYSPKNGSGGLAGEGPLQPGLCDLCDAVSSQQWYPNTIGATTGTTSISYHQQNGGLSSTLCHECWTHWKKYGGPRTATSDKKVIASARGGSMSGDEDRPHSNASSSSVAAAMNLNVSAGGGRSSSHGPTMSTPPHHHHHLMHLGGSGSSHHSNYHHQLPHHHHQQLHHQQQQQQHQQQHQSSASSPGGGGLLLHQPHINSSGSTTTAHRCTIIGCQAALFKSKSQLLRHYSTAHGIGLNSNSSSSSSAIISSIGGSGRSSGSAGLDGGGSGKLSPQPPQQQQAVSGAGLLHHNSGGPLNLNSSNSIQHSINSGSASQVINLIASSSSPQQQPNNLSTSSGGITTNTVIGTGGVATATGRPVMKTRTAFYLRCTSLAKASRRRAAQQAAAALLQQQHHQKKASSSGAVLSPIASAMVQPGCLARPRNVARRPFVCVPQTAHTYKHECMLSMQHAPVHELRAYLRAAAVKAHARRPGVTRVANALIAARRGRGGMNSATAADIAVPDWLSLPSQQHQHQSSHHHVSSSSKHGKHSSRSSTGGRVAFPKPPKAPDGSLLYERVPNKQEAAAAAAAAASALNNPSAAAAAAAAAAAVGLNPAAAAAILGALGPPGSASSGNSAGASGSSNDQSASGFDVAAAAAALYQQQQQQQQQQLQQGSSSSSNKRRLYETDGATIQQQPQPQAGPPSKRMHRQQHHSQQQQQQQQSTGHHHLSQQHPQPSSTSLGGSGAGGGAVDGMLASIVAHQQQQQQQRGGTSSGGPLKLTATGSGGKSGGHHQSQQHQQHNHYRTPSMARTGRKHVISWTDAPDDLYYRCTSLSRSLRKARMTGKELRRSARKPWQPIAALLGISFTMPSSAASSSATPLGTAGPTGSPAPQTSSTSGNPSSIGSAAPFDMSTTGGGTSSNNRQPSTISNQSATPIVASCISGALPMSSRSSGSGSSHH